jgi:hypothetical protein
VTHSKLLLQLLKNCKLVTDFNVFLLKKSRVVFVAMANKHEFVASPFFVLAYHQPQPKPPTGVIA